MITPYSERGVAQNEGGSPSSQGHRAPSSYDTSFQKVVSDPENVCLKKGPLWSVLQLLCLCSTLALLRASHRSSDYQPRGSGYRSLPDIEQTANKRILDRSKATIEERKQFEALLNFSSSTSWLHPDRDPSQPPCTQHKRRTRPTRTEWLPASDARANAPRRLPSIDVQTRYAQCRHMNRAVRDPSASLDSRSPFTVTGEVIPSKT